LPGEGVAAVPSEEDLRFIGYSIGRYGRRNTGTQAEGQTDGASRAETDRHTWKEEKKQEEI